jgi:hypothetical protein
MRRIAWHDAVERIARLRLDTNGGVWLDLEPRRIERPSASGRMPNGMFVAPRARSGARSAMTSAPVHASPRHPCSDRRLGLAKTMVL